MPNTELKIPKERIPILIGKQGKIKQKIEEETSTKLQIDSEEGDVIISGEDGLKVLLAKKIIQAIARGFNPKIAFNLLEENTYLELVNITEYSKKSQKALFRIRSRAIGTEGRARKNIEKMTNCNISIYGKTVAIIGKSEDINIAKKAMEQLILGSPHSNVYYFIERQKQRSNQ